MISKKLNSFIEEQRIQERRRIEIFSKPERITLDIIEEGLKTYIENPDILNTIMCQIIDYGTVCESQSKLFQLLKLERTME